MKKLVVLLLFFLTLVSPLRPVYAGVASHAKGKITDTIPLKLIGGTLFGFDISGLIMPLVDQPKENSMPDEHPYAAYFSKVGLWARPVVIQIKTNDWTNRNPISKKYCVKLVMTPPYMSKIVKYALTRDTIEVSKDWEDTRIAGQNGEILASWNGLWKKAPSVGGPLNDNEIDPSTSNVLGTAAAPSPGGLYDYNYIPHVISNISTEDCGLQNDSVDVPQEKIDVVQLASLGGGCNGDLCAQFSTAYTGPDIIETIEKIIDGILTTITRPVIAHFPLRIEVTAKHGDSSGANQRAKTGKCSGGDTKDPQTARLCDQDGQWTAGFIPRQEYKDVAHHGLENQDITLSGNGSKGTTLPVAYKTENSMQKKANDASCFAAPKQIQNELSIGDDKSNVPLACSNKVFTCPINVVLEGNPKIPDNSCKLGAAGYPKDSDLLTPLEQSAFPGGMPKNLAKVLDYVGGLYSVPPSVVLANMLEEGAFEHYPDWQWTNESVITYSDCTRPDPMPKCNDSSFQSSTGAKGPLGIFQTQIDKVDLKSKNEYNNPYWKVLDDPEFKDVLENRPEGTFGACNFFDAALYAAWDIYENQQHLYGIPVPGSCTAGTPPTEYPLSQDSNRASSCSNWTADRAALARWQYDDRICDNGIARTVQTFNKY